MSKLTQVKTRKEPGIPCCLMVSFLNGRIGNTTLASRVISVDKDKGFGVAGPFGAIKSEVFLPPRILREAGIVAVLKANMVVTATFDGFHPKPKAFNIELS